MKLFTEFDFDKLPDEEAVESSVKLEYIKELIVFAKSDKQSVFMYFAFALAAIGFVIEKFDTSIQSAGFWHLTFFYIGILFLIMAAMSYFMYWRKIHRTQMSIISCIPSLNIKKARGYWIELWKENQALFKLGLGFLVVGNSIIFITTVWAKFAEAFNAVKLPF